MNETIPHMSLVFEMLKKTSRTFYIPINQLTPGIKEAVTSAYLCMRAIDEIEDDPNLSPSIKIKLLEAIHILLSLDTYEEQINEILKPYTAILPEVTLRLTDWIAFAPTPTQSTILQSTSIMAKGMAKWVGKGWMVQTEEDLDDYTYYVAGLVGVLLSDLWKQYENIETDYDLAISFGRGLQAVNIIRNRVEDLERGVDFFPNGWDIIDMLTYARHHLSLAQLYIKDVPPGPLLNFCKIPLGLAHATLETLEAGHTKLTRSEVNEIVSQITKSD